MRSILESPKNIMIQCLVFKNSPFISHSLYNATVMPSITFSYNTGQLKLIVSQLGGSLRSELLPRNSGNCALNDSVFKFKIYSVEMQDLSTNTNLADLLVLVFSFGRTLTKNFSEYLQVFRVSCLWYMATAVSTCEVIKMGNTYQQALNMLNI